MKIQSSTASAGLLCGCAGLVALLVYRVPLSGFGHPAALVIALIGVAGPLWLYGRLYVHRGFFRLAYPFRRRTNLVLLAEIHRIIIKPGLLTRLIVQLGAERQVRFWLLGLPRYALLTWVHQARAAGVSIVVR